MANDDSECGVIPCPNDTACVDYPDEIAINRCAELGTCITGDACEPEYAMVGTECAYLTGCDEQGSCSVPLPGIISILPRSPAPGEAVRIFTQAMDTASITAIAIGGIPVSLDSLVYPPILKKYSGQFGAVVPIGVLPGEATVEIASSSDDVIPLAVDILAAPPPGPSPPGEAIFPDDEDIKTPPILSNEYNVMGVGPNPSYTYMFFGGGLQCEASGTVRERHIDTRRFALADSLGNFSHDIYADYFWMEFDRDEDGLFETQYTGEFVARDPDWFGVLAEDQEGRQLLLPLSLPWDPLTCK